MKIIKPLIVLVLVSSLLTGCNFNLANLPIIGNSQPPFHIFTLRSIADVEAVLNAEKMNDTEIEEFFSQNRQRLSLESKNQITDFSEILRTVGYPTVNFRVDEEHFGVTVYPETWEYTVIYSINDIFYRFDYVPNGDYVDPAGRKVMGNYEIDGIEFPLYQGDSKILINYIYANGYRIRISAYRYENVSDISFEPFSWSTDMKLAD